MLNYIKADFYRLFKSKGFYVALIFLLACAFLTALLPPGEVSISLSMSNDSSYYKLITENNLLDYEVRSGFDRINATIQLFSALLTSQVMSIFVIAVSSMLLMAEQRSHTFKNSVSKGFSRHKVVNIKFAELFLLSVLFLITYIVLVPLIAFVFHGAGPGLNAELWGAFFAGFGMQVLYVAALCAFATFLGFTFKKGAAFNTVYIIFFMLQLFILALPLLIWEDFPTIVDYDFGYSMSEASIITEVAKKELLRVCLLPIGYIVVFFPLAHVMFRKSEIK
jgi:ABC-2 type transport system permease protein